MFHRSMLVPCKPDISEIAALRDHFIVCALRAPSILCCLQDKVNGGYTDLMQQVQKATGIPVFVAPIGLAWQAVHSILSEEAADQQLQDNTRAASDLANIIDPAGDIDMPSGAPDAVPELANASSQASNSNNASALPIPTASSSSAAVASFVAVPNAPLAAGDAPGQQPPSPEVNLALLTAICKPRPASAAPAPAPVLPVAVTGQPEAPATAAAAHVMPGLVDGLPYTTAAAGRKLLRQSVPSYSRYKISAQRAAGALASSNNARRRRSLQVALAKPATAAPAAAVSQGQPAVLPPTTLITRVNSSAANANAPAPVPEVTVPDVDQGELVRQEISVSAQSAPAPSPSSNESGDLILPLL